MSRGGNPIDINRQARGIEQVQSVWSAKRLSKTGSGGTETGEKKRDV